MWVTKLKICCEGALIGGLCKKFNVSAIGHPVFMKVDGEERFVYFTLFLNGEDNSKKAFIEELRTSKRLVGLECNDDLIFAKISEGAVTKPLYEYDLIHIKPVQFNSDGTEVWTLGSWKKEKLVEFINQVEKMFPITILKLHQRNISSISILTVHPDLTDLQRNAMDLAVKCGYYNSPRNVELKVLAEKMGISYSTFQVHLRKAEKKLLPFYFNHGKESVF